MKSSFEPIWLPMQWILHFAKGLMMIRYNWTPKLTNWLTWSVELMNSHPFYIICYCTPLYGWDLAKQRLQSLFSGFNIPWILRIVLSYWKASAVSIWWMNHACWSFIFHMVCIFFHWNGLLEISKVFFCIHLIKMMRMRDEKWAHGK